MNDAQWGVLMAAVSAAWTKAEPLDGPTQLFWRSLLSELPDGDAVTAIQSLVRDGVTFRPEVGEIYRRAVDLRTGAPDPDVAWLEVMDQVRAVGHVGRPSFGDERVAQAVQTIGWLEICGSRAGDTALRAQFRDIYRAVCERAAAAARYRGISGGGELPGLHQPAAARRIS